MFTCCVQVGTERNRAIILDIYALYDPETCLLTIPFSPGAGLQLCKALEDRWADHVGLPKQWASDRIVTWYIVTSQSP